MVSVTAVIVAGRRLAVNNGGRPTGDISRVRKGGGIIGTASASTGVGGHSA